MNDTYDLHIKSFQELTLEELYAILQLRMDVFVVEQVCPYLDLDDLDQASTHLWIGEGSDVLAYVRVVHEQGAYCSIGRVVNASSHRGQGLGLKIFQAGIDFCEKHIPDRSIKISAQLYLKRFYSSFGFEQVGKVYLEDGIPHIGMVRS